MTKKSRHVAFGEIGLGGKEHFERARKPTLEYVLDFLYGFLFSFGGRRTDIEEANIL